MSWTHIRLKWYRNHHWRSLNAPLLIFYGHEGWGWNFTNYNHKNWIWAWFHSTPESSYSTPLMIARDRIFTPTPNVSEWIRIGHGLGPIPILACIELAPFHSQRGCSHSTSLSCFSFMKLLHEWESQVCNARECSYPTMQIQYAVQMWFQNPPLHWNTRRMG